MNSNPRLWSDRKLRHEWRQEWLHGTDEVLRDETLPLFSDHYIALHKELTKRLKLRPLEECVCEECWPFLPQATG